MKNFLTALLLFFYLNINAQTTDSQNSLSIGESAFITANSSVFGIMAIDSKGETTTYKGALQIQPMINFGKFSVGLVSYTIFVPTNSLPKTYVGIRPSYIVWETPNKQNSLAISPNYMYRSGGYQLFGGDIDYRINKTIVTLGCNWDYKNKTALVRLGTGFTFLK